MIPELVEAGAIQKAGRSMLEKAANKIKELNWSLSVALATNKDLQDLVTAKNAEIRQLEKEVQTLALAAKPRPEGLMVRLVRAWRNIYH